MIVDPKIKGKYIGYFMIDGVENGTKIGLTKKPNRFRRIFYWIFLGWKWKNFK